MAAQLFPILYKPGIRRDGTPFQSEYCTDGQWVRFQKGRIRKIGGMAGVDFRRNAEPLTQVSNILIFSNPDSNDLGNKYYVYVASAQGIFARTIHPNFATPNAPAEQLNLAINNPLALWQSAIVINPGNNKRHIVFLSTNSAQSINDSTPPVLYEGELFSGNLVNNTFTGVDPDSNGGLCYSHPYLFLYGSNGTVQYSANNNPFNFTINANNPASGGKLNISEDKVIFGRPIRGGSNSPSILFWTLSSVIRVTNVGDLTVEFRKDVISKSSSILSTRCVVEYDGLFFWPGTDRFFVYNGTCVEMINNTNVDYFFGNLHFGQRQNVFGVKNPRYGEIWWFYTEKGKQGNSRAIIYNKRENSWYDTAITREAGVYFDQESIFATYGKSMTEPNNGRTFLWRHEESITGGERFYLQPNQYKAKDLPSFFTTPTISWAAFNPMQQLTGIDKWVEVRRIEPDFLIRGSGSKVQVVINTREYAGSIVDQTDPIDINHEKTDVNVQGRHISFTFIITGNYDLEMGHTLLLLSTGDGR